MSEKNEYLRKLDDPELDANPKLSSDDYFELVYMRHRYFRQSTNPSPERLAQFEDMIVNMADRVYYKNSDTFKTTGMEVEDIRNIGRVHAVSWISMGGLHENPKLMKKFIKDHKDLKGKDSTPTDKDIFLRECKVLAAFLRQRLPEMIRFCRKKNQNVRGSRGVNSYYVGDPKRNPNDYDLVSSPEKFGYKKITKEEYKKMVKEGSGEKSHFLNKEKLMVRFVKIQPSFLTQKDIENTDLDPRRSEFYRSPEDILLVHEGYRTGAIKDFE